MMKYRNCFPLLALLLTPLLAHPQPRVLEDAWSDRDFVERFTGTFLPLTEQEPKISEEEAELFQELATVLEANDYAQAITRLERRIANAPAEEPVSAALDYTLANLYLQQGRFADAAQRYEVAIDKHDTFRRAYKNLGLARIQNQEFGPAIQALVKAVELGDGGGDTFGLLAYSYLNEDNPVAALEGYRQASLLNPGNREWRIGKAEALMRTERFPEAIAEFKSLILEQPERNAFYTSIANAYLSLEDTTAAAQYLEILRRRGEAEAPALGLLGDIYLNDGLASLAVEVYIDALETGDYPPQRSIRSLNALLQRGHYAEAEAFINRFESLQQTALSETLSREVLNLKAQLALAKGSDAEAAALLEEVLQADPLNGNALTLLGQYHQNREEFEEAIYYYERALGLTDFQREAQLQLARIYVKQKEYLQAIRQLEAALDLQYASNVQDFLDAVRAVYNRSL